MSTNDVAKQLVKETIDSGEYPFNHRVVYKEKTYSILIIEEGATGYSLEKLHENINSIIHASGVNCSRCGGSGKEP
jgi:hypothetical protein